MNAPMRSTFTARYFGTCEACLESVVPRQEVAYNANDDLVHAECPEVVEEPKVPACSDCHLMHAGKCF